MWEDFNGKCHSWCKFYFCCHDDDDDDDEDDDDDDDMDEYHDELFCAMLD